MAIVASVLLIALMLSVKRQQLTAHKFYCEEKCTKVLQTCIFLSPHTFMFLGVTNAIGSISQNKHQLNTSNKNVNLCKNTKNTNYLLKIHKLSNKWLILLTQKAVFQLICSTCHHYQMQGGSLQCSARYPMIFSCQMGKTHDSAKSSIIGRSTD